MRILGGEARGRILKSREGNGTRPTDARSREMLFNIIAARTVGARVLDLYAGSGSLGLEAVSRGATSALLIEQNAYACRVIRDNIAALDFENRARVWQDSVKNALRRLNEKTEPFDLIFADPPFGRDTELPELRALLDNSSRLLHNGKKPFAALLVVQHHWKADLTLGSAYKIVQQRRAGESLLSFFELADDAVSDDENSSETEETTHIEYSKAGDSHSKTPPPDDSADSLLHIKH